MSRPTFMTIDTAALRHNLARARELAPGCAVIAMVKANAYGHGLARVAQALDQADALGVASVEEGVRLREAGIQQPIVLMEGVFYPDELAEAARHHFTLVVHHEPHIEMLEKIQVERPFRIWLKVNSGMHRLGFAPEEVGAAYTRLMQTPAVHKPIGFMTHFAKADALTSPQTTEQINLFHRTISHLSGPRSMANSAAVIAWPHSHGEWVRPGLMLYGASPFPNRVGADHGLKPVMTLWSRLIAITQVKKGGAVGYGGEWTAPEDMHVGVIGVGYGDGYPQYAKSGTPVMVGQVECPVVGRVSMDMMTVDLRMHPNAKINDPVLLWGHGLPVERIARHSQTSAYEILTRMTPRPKIEVHEMTCENYFASLLSS